MSFRLEIVTPEGKAFSDEVSDVVLPGGAGEMDVLPQHSNLVTTLVPGEVRFKDKAGQTHELAVGAGFAEIQGDHVHVLTEMAVRDPDINVEAVEAAMARAQQRLKDAAELDAEEIAAVEASIANSLAQLKLKRKRRTL
jgi:F-type H+-transporting ATPase subunit epsilon